MSPERACPTNLMSSNLRRFAHSRATTRSSLRRRLQLGKTIIGQFVIFLARKYSARAIYTTPIKALSNQKYRDFRAIWGDDQVGLLTGDIVVNRDPAILVMTTEVLRNSLVTGHSFGSGQRGAMQTPAEDPSDGSESPKWTSEGHRHAEPRSSPT